MFSSTPSIKADDRDGIDLKKMMLATHTGKDLLGNNIQFKTKESRLVYMYEYAVTDAQSETPILATYGMSTCTGLALFNKADNTALLMHFVSMHSLNLKELPIVLKRFGFDKPTVEAHVMNGYMHEDRARTPVLVRNILASFGINIATENQGSTFAIDARTGQVFAAQSYLYAEPSEGMRPSMQRIDKLTQQGRILDIRLELSFDARKKKGFIDQGTPSNQSSAVAAAPVLPSQATVKTTPTNTSKVNVSDSWARAGFLNPAGSLPSSQQTVRLTESKSFTIEQTSTVAMKEYALTDADSAKPILYTHGLTSCIALVLYKRETKTAFMAHFAGVDNLKEILLSLGFNTGTVEAHIVAGANRKPDLERLAKWSNTLSQEQLLEMLISLSMRVVSHKKGARIAIDARTGELVDAPHEQFFDRDVLATISPGFAIKLYVDARGAVSKAITNTVDAYLPTLRRGFFNKDASTRPSADASIPPSTTVVAAASTATTFPGFSRGFLNPPK